VLVISSSSLVVCQSYNTAAGFRIGSDFGITAVQRVAKRNTIELIYEDGLFESNRNFDVLFKHHLPLISKGFNFYTGLGIGFASGVGQDMEQTDRTLSIPGVIGAEITLGKFNISADFQPTLLMREINDERFVRSSGVSIRYVLVKRKKKKRKKIFGDLFKQSKSKKK